MMSSYSLYCAACVCLSFNKHAMFNDNARYLHPCVTMATQKSCNLIDAILHETLVHLRV